MIFLGIFAWWNSVGNSNRKNTAALLDSDDTDSLSSASSSVRSDMISVGFGADVEKDNLLDQSLDALYEKR